MSHLQRKVVHALGQSGCGDLLECRLWLGFGISQLNVNMVGLPGGLWLSGFDFFGLGLWGHFVQEGFHLVPEIQRDLGALFGCFDFAVE
jgi:hypothetical protein